MYVLGIDRFGYEHVYDDRRGRIIVLDSRGIDFQGDWAAFPGDTTADWERYVADQRGPWRETARDRAMGAIQEVFA